MKHAFLALVCIQLLSLATVAQAQSRFAKAQSPFAQADRVDHAGIGARDFNAGRYREALDHYSRAYEASGAPILLYNIGQAADRLRLDATTLRAFQLYLQRYPDAPNRDEVHHRIEVLTPLVATQSQALDAAKAAAEQEPSKPETQASSVRLNVSETLLPSPYRFSAKSERTVSPDLVDNVWFWVAAGAVVVAVVCTVVLITSDAPSSVDNAGAGGASLGAGALTHRF